MQSTSFGKLFGSVFAWLVAETRTVLLRWVVVPREGLDSHSRARNQSARYGACTFCEVQGYTNRFWRCHFLCVSSSRPPFFLTEKNVRWW